MEEHSELNQPPSEVIRRQVSELSTEEFNKAVGKIIKDRLLNLGKTQGDFAKAYGLRPQFVSDISRDAYTHKISDPLLGAIAFACGLDIGAFLGEVHRHTARPFNVPVAAASDTSRLVRKLPPAIALRDGWFELYVNPKATSLASEYPLAPPIVPAMERARRDVIGKRASWRFLVEGLYVPRPGLIAHAIDLVENWRARNRQTPPPFPSSGLMAGLVTASLCCFCRLSTNYSDVILKCKRSSSISRRRWLKSCTY